MFFSYFHEERVKYWGAKARVLSEKNGLFSAIFNLLANVPYIRVV